MTFFCSTTDTPNSSERAVSPVIGIALILAITVVMSSIITGFVYANSGTFTERPPEASFQFNAQANQDALHIVHDGGVTVDADNLHVRFDADGDGTVEQRQWSTWSSDGTVSQGNEFVIHPSTGDWNTTWKGQTDVEVVWVSDSGSKSEIIASLPSIPN